MDFWQIFTLITGVIYMILEIRQKNFMWVVGIATSLAAMWVFFRQGLYASFGLNTYYFIINIPLKSSVWKGNNFANAFLRSSKLSATIIS